MRRFLTMLSVVLIGVGVVRGAWADAPSVTVTYPLANAVIDQGVSPTVLLQASATDPDEAISSVTFLVCGPGAMCWTPAGRVAAAPFQLRWTLPLPTGIPSMATTNSYQVSVVGENVFGQTRQSDIVSFTVIQPPMPSSVMLVAPNGPNGETGFVTPASPVLYATAYNETVPPSTIDHVDFLDGAAVIGTVNTPNAVPSGYAFVWQNAPAGMHLIAARATNTLGYSATSSLLNVYVVGPDPPPQVTLTAPMTGQIFAPESTVPLAATATSALGTIQRVEFMARDTVIDTAYGPPYAASWINPPPGNFAIVARAFDDVGVAATSPAAYVQVLAASRAPAIVLTAPALGTTFASGSPLPMAATALAPDGGVGRVDFYAGETLLGSSPTAPYQFMWTSPIPGAQSLTGKAYDLQGNAGISAPVAVTVTSHPPPMVSLTAPSNNTAYGAPATISLNATASANGASISKVEFFANTTLVASLTTAPYNTTWSNVAAGAYALTAKATDSLGAVASSGSIAVTVSANQPPQVTLIAPSGGQTFSGKQPITLSATALDPDGIVARVEFLADGAVIGSATAVPFTMVWNGATTGVHALAVRATDNRGSATTSAVVNITVTNNVPTVALSLPRDGDTFATAAAIALAATATDSDGTIARVEFYADAALVATATVAPYSATWSNATPGTHTLLAKAVDDQGAVTTSANIAIQVASQTLTITTPPAGVVVAADFVLVSGTYQAPPNSGVTVNGVVANSDGQGHYFVNNLSLVDGTNTLTATLTTSDGQTTSQTTTLTRTGVAPMQIYAETDSDFAPATFIIRVRNRGAIEITNVSFQNLGNGQLDMSTMDQTTLGKITYTTPGVYAPAFVISDAAGNTYTQTMALLARDKGALDQMLKAVWEDFANALAAGDKNRAMTMMSVPARQKYGPVIDALLPYLPQIIPQWSPPLTGMLATEVGEFTIGRTVAGVKRAFFVYLVVDQNGIWRLVSM